MGVRYMSPAWSISTSWAGSSGDDVGRTRGLNEFGKSVVREMNRLGMMIDVSHVSDPTFWDIVNTSTAPVVATHSACRAIADVPRNLTDEMIRALANTGGVVNVIFYPEHLEPGWSQKKKQVDVEIDADGPGSVSGGTGQCSSQEDCTRSCAAREYARRLPPVNVSRIVDHIDHIVKLVGVDHVGSDLISMACRSRLRILRQWRSCRTSLSELLSRGYSETTINKILGGNMLRVMDAHAR